MEIVNVGKVTNIVQIISSDAYYYDEQTHRQMKHNTLFALDAEGRIWTRYYDGESYREWFPVNLRGLPKADKVKA